MLRSNPCDYSDVYIVVTGKINVANPNNDGCDKKLELKSNAPLFICITKIIRKLIENAEDLDVVRPLYDLLRYSKNFRRTTASLWNYYRTEPNSSYKKKRQR